MSTSDRILDLIDAGLQHSTESGELLAGPGWCTRCTRFPVATDSEFCPTCRAWLLGDIDEPRSEFTDAIDALVRRTVAASEELSMDVLLYGNAYVDPTTRVRVDPMEVVGRRAGDEWHYWAPGAEGSGERRVERMIGDQPPTMEWVDISDLVTRATITRGRPEETPSERIAGITAEVLAGEPLIDMGRIHREYQRYIDSDRSVMRFEQWVSPDPDAVSWRITLTPPS